MTNPDPIVQAVAEALIDHTRLGIEGKCHCGHEVPLGHSFAMHQAEAAVAGLEPLIRAREAAAWDARPSPWQHTNPFEEEANSP